MQTQTFPLNSATTLHLYSQPSTQQVSHALWLQYTYLPAHMPYLADGGDPDKPGEGGIRAMVAFAVSMIHSITYAEGSSPLDAEGKPATWHTLPVVMTSDNTHLLARVAVVLAWPPDALVQVTAEINRILNVDVQLEGN